MPSCSYLNQDEEQVCGYKIQVRVSEILLKKVRNLLSQPFLNSSLPRRSTMVTNICEDFEPPTKNFLAKPLIPLSIFFKIFCKVCGTSAKYACYSNCRKNVTDCKILQQCIIPSKTPKIKRITPVKIVATIQKKFSKVRLT